MKKLLACLLILCLISVIICACGNKDNADTNTNGTTTLADDPTSDGGSDSVSDSGDDGSDSVSDSGDDGSDSGDDGSSEVVIPDISNEPVSPNPDEDGKVSKYY